MYSCTIGLFIDFVECSFASAHGYVVNDVNITVLVLHKKQIALNSCIPTARGIGKMNAISRLNVSKDC